MRPLLRRPRFEEKRRRKKKSNFNSLILPPKELEAQEVRPLLRRPRFEEKNKKENKMQHHFLECAAKKTKRKRCACSSAGGASKGIVEKASGSRTPLFFQGGGCRMIENVE